MRPGTSGAHFFRCSGRLGISNKIWEKPGPLTVSEWERVRLAPQLGERMLRQSEALGAVAPHVGQLRERLDGSGYPAGLTAGSITAPARLLAAADSYQAMIELRPHRGPLTADEAATQLHDEVRAGRLERASVDAVLAAAGHRTRRRGANVAGLTNREIEVLELAARGLSNRDIARRLTVTPKTVGNHIEHIYTKIGETSRAAFPAAARIRISGHVYNLSTGLVETVAPADEPPRNAPLTPSSR